jgi:hypothetical protein
MSREILRGVNITCDGCGEEIFIDEKDLGTNEFGWLHVRHSIDYSEVDFCPTCAEAYKDVLSTFMNSRKIIRAGKMLRKGFEDGIKGLREPGEEEATE